MCYIDCKRFTFCYISFKKFFDKISLFSNRIEKLTESFW